MHQTQQMRSDTHPGTSLRGYIEIVAVVPLAVALGTAVAAAAGSISALVLIGVALVTMVQWNFLKRMLRQPVPFPGLVVAGINGVGALGWVFYPSIADRAAVTAVFSDTVYGPAAAIFTVASLGVFTGGILASRLSQKSRAISLAEVKYRSVELISSIQLGRLSLASLLPLFLLYVAFTPGALIERINYSDAAGPAALVRIASIAMPVGVALVSLVYMRATGSQRIAAGALLIVYTLSVFSTGSRGLATIPGMLILAWLLVQGQKRSTKLANPRNRLRLFVSASAACWFTLLFLNLPLALRGNPAGSGLVPYVNVLRERPNLLFTVDLPKILGNILFSLPLTGMTASLQPFPREWFYTSVSPLPSGLTDWSTIIGNLRLNAYTPTSGFGELANYGWPYLITFTVVTGYILAALQIWNSRLPGLMAVMSTVMGFGVVGALTSALMQYNLRAGTRYIWYFTLFSSLLHLMPRIRHRRKPNLRSMSFNT